VADPTGAQMLGRYQVLKHLATGGMAEVLMARVTGIENFERHVVVKRIRPEQARDSKFVAMFLDEARLAACLHHNNIVQVHDIGEEGGEYFFTMEYVHGEDLRRVLTHLAANQRKMPFEHVITIVMSVASALHYAHELHGTDRKPLHIVHRDVSPANILVAYDGNVKVVDFGIAKAARSAQTRSGTLKGKVAYMAPEQCNGQQVDRRSDVFALGIVLYELVTVRRLFKGDTDFLTMSQIVNGKVPKPSLHRPDLPKKLEEIILKALAPDPAKRFQTADELRQALEQFAAKANLRTSTTGLADYMLEQFGRRAEPWLVDDDYTVELDVDFDGSGSGVAPMPDVPIDNLPISSKVWKLGNAPIARARARELGIDEPATEWGADNAPTTASGTPMAWASHPMAPHRRRWWLVAVPVAAIAGIAAVVVGTGMVDVGGGAPVGTPSATPVETAKPIDTAKTTDTEVPKPSPPPASTGSEATNGPSDEAAKPTPAVAAGSDSADAKPKPRKRIVKPAPSSPKGSWDRDSLFPK
jgi:serine/threonine protein kinase